VGCVQARVSEWSLLTLPSPISELQHALLPLKVLWARERAPTLPSSVVFYLGSHLNLLRSWECVSPWQLSRPVKCGSEANTPWFIFMSSVCILYVQFFCTKDCCIPYRFSNLFSVFCLEILAADLIAFCIESLAKIQVCAFAWIL